MRRALLLLVAPLLVSCATTQPPATLAQRIDAITAKAPLDQAIWGINVVDDAGKTLYARNERMLMTPASNRKLFAAATVASCNPLDQPLTTELWRDGDDIILRGGGDPSLGGRWAYDRDAVFAPFIAALRARGIDHVHDVIADVSLFDRVTIPGSWKAGNLGSDYAVPTDALAYNENVVGIVADRCASPIVATDPSFVPVNAAVTCGKGEPVVRSDMNNVIAIDGNMPEHFRTLVGIGDPALYAVEALRDALRHAGITQTGNEIVNVTPRTWRERIAVIESPPLWQILSVVLKPSQNLYAEMLFKGLSGSYDGSEEIERRFLTTEAGIAGSDFHFVDGSGLSPDDLVTPRAIVTILRWMNDPVRRGIWSMMMAQPGEEGTLRRRLLPFAGRLHGKTGTINGVNALSGILDLPGGGHRYFSIIINHNAGDSSEALHAIDAIVGEIAK